MVSVLVTCGIHRCLVKGGSRLERVIHTLITDRRREDTVCWFGLVGAESVPVATVAFDHEVLSTWRLITGKYHLPVALLLS